MPEPTNTPPSKRFTVTSLISLCTVGLATALVTVTYIYRSKTFSPIKLERLESSSVMPRVNLKVGETDMKQPPGSPRFYACRNVLLELSERIPDYPHPVGTQTDFRIKMAYWPGIPLYEPHYIPMLRGRYHPAYVPDKRGKLAWFCHNYMKQPLNPPRYYTYNNDWVKFNAWIPEYLQSASKTVMRTKMMKEPNAPDKPGCIYAFEIEDPRTSDKIYIKVGRSNSLDARLASWTQHYSPAVIRHIYPRKDMTTDLAEVPAHMFLESLIHTELGDLERHAARYYTNFPNAKPSLPGVQMSKSRCIKADCRVVHREVYSFERCVLDGRDIDEIVVGVI